MIMSIKTEEIKYFCWHSEIEEGFGATVGEMDRFN